MNASENPQLTLEKKNILETLLTKFREERDLICNHLFCVTLDDIIKDYKRWDLPLNLIPGVDALKLLTEAVIDKKTLGGMRLDTIRERTVLSAITVLHALGHYAYFSGQSLSNLISLRGAAAATYLLQFGANDANAILASINSSYPTFPTLQKIVLAARDVLISLKHPIRVSKVIQRKTSRLLRKRNTKS